MKKFLLITLLMSASTVSISQELKYDAITPYQDFEGVFIVSNQKEHKEYARLDCQSFIQKFDFFDKNDKLKTENVISFEECEYIYNNTMHCFNTEGYKCINAKDILSQKCECNE